MLYLLILCSTASLTISELFNITDSLFISDYVLATSYKSPDYANTTEEVLLLLLV